MRKISTILLGFILLSLHAVYSQENYFIMSGCSSNRISIIEKLTQKELWSHPLEKSQECNSAAMDAKGRVVYSYKQGAKLVTLDHKVVWDYQSGEKTELQYADVLPDGGYILGICGTPSKIVELNKKGKVRKEITFETGIKHPHGQFRIITKTKKGTYIVPVMGGKTVLELDANGKEISRQPLNAKNIFSALELNENKILVSAGDEHQIVSLDIKTGENKCVVAQNDIPGISLLFVARICLLSNGNMIVCNWDGHSGEAGIKEPQLVEIDTKNQLVWQLNDKKTFGKISTIQIVNNKKAIKSLTK
jgi:outer membrane protein assembly factor BamB